MKDNWIIINKITHKLQNASWVCVIAEIKNNSTGEIREYETHEILEDGDELPSVFNWKENNFSCDCNRRIFFKRAKNEEDEDHLDIPCSYGLFSVNLKNKLNRYKYYSEFYNKK
jgi:hypothetical protein